MCEIISNQEESDFSRNTRALRISGHATSVQLENHFWRVLEAIAVREKRNVVGACASILFSARA